MNPQKAPAWSGEGDPSPALWLLDPDAEKVDHRGLTYPARFSWTWTRTDGLVVVLDVRMDPERGPVPVEVTIRSPEGIASGDYRQPIPSMARMAAAQYAWRLTEPAPGSFRAEPVSGPVVVGPVVGRRITARTDDERLARVVELYHHAITEGLGVTELIEESEKVSTRTAYGLIGAARAAGLLPPARPGRKARTGDE